MGTPAAALALKTGEQVHPLLFVHLQKQRSESTK